LGEEKICAPTWKLKQTHFFVKKKNRRKEENRKEKRAPKGGEKQAVTLANKAIRNRGGPNL